MTVKRGKYVKEVIEYLFDNGPQTLEAIYLQSSAISEDYVKNAVLNRLLEEAELFYDPASKEYRLAASVKPTWPRSDHKAFTVESSETVVDAKAEWRQTAMMPTEEPFLADDFPVTPVKRDYKPSQWAAPKASATVVRTEGKMPRHKETEFILSLAWLQDMTDIDSAVAHYCDTHLAKSEVITLKDKKIGGERLDFHSVKEEK